MFLAGTGITETDYGIVIAGLPATVARFKDDITIDNF